MSDLIRPEVAHAINGVPGRLFALRIPPAHWKAGTFGNQTWVSEARPIKGYGSEATLRVFMRFDDNCRNGHNDFAITAEVRQPGARDVVACGCLHDDIAKVFPELAPLVKWHLSSTAGPMHYVANTVYHAAQHGATHAWVYFTGAVDPLGIGDTKERLVGYVKTSEAKKAEGQPSYRVEWDAKTVKVANLGHARSCAVWPDATDEQLCADEATLTAALAARLPALLADFRNDMEAVGFLWSSAP